MNEVPALYLRIQMHPLPWWVGPQTKPSLDFSDKNSRKVGVGERKTLDLILMWIHSSQILQC